jgi:hypothetical protein
MTATNHVCPEPLVLTSADLRGMQQDLEHDVRVITELAERLGRDELGPSDLFESGQPEPIADRVLRRRLLRAVLRHTRRAARLAQLLLELSDQPNGPHRRPNHTVTRRQPVRHT